ncbi:MAG: hypothetical protein ABJM75_03635 [Luteolibacter sp.]
MGFGLIHPFRYRSHFPATMGQQSNKIVKRRRRADYLKRKKEQAKLGEILPKVKKAPAKKEASADEKPEVKKAPAKKAAKKATAKKAAKKAPAKKAAKKEEAPESTSED